MIERFDINTVGKWRMIEQTQADWDRVAKLPPPQVLKELRTYGRYNDFHGEMIRAWREWGYLTDRQYEVLYGDLVHEYAADRFKEAAAVEIAKLPLFPALIQRVQAGETVVVGPYKVKAQSDGSITIKEGARKMGYVDPRGFVIGYLDGMSPDFRVDPWDLMDLIAQEHEPVMSVPVVPVPPEPKRGFFARLFG